MFKKFTWGHGIVVALLLFMIFILSMIFIFTQGWQNSEMVSEHYYEDELNYQKVIDAKKNAERLANIPHFEQKKDIGIVITMPSEALPDNKAVHFELFRTDDAQLDVKKDLTTDDNHQFIIPKMILREGSYTLKVRWEYQNTPYQVDYDVLWNQH